MPTKKPKYLFVLGEKYEAEQVPLFDIFIWGNEKGYQYRYTGCGIVYFLLKVKDFGSLSESVEIAPNHSAILPLEV
jgi:hypothetical protein